MFDAAEGMDPEALAGCDADELEEAIGQVLAVEASVRRMLLQLIAAYGRTEGWLRDGAPNLQAWLAGHFALSYGTASELVRVALALESLPNIAAALNDGRLSYDQVRPLVTTATLDTDAEDAADAEGRTVADLVARARRARRADDASADRRFLRWRWESDGAALRVSGRFPGADGEAVAAALERVSDEAPPQPNGIYARLEVRAADAFLELAGLRLGADADADRATVVIHATPEAIKGLTSAELANGSAIAHSTLQRLCCDARIQLVLETPGGEVVTSSIQRTASPAQVRQLRRRDNGCRFPGCGRRRWLHAHHIVHWPDGPTEISNLVLLCGYHHRFMHEHKWWIEGDPAGDLVFRTPTGHRLDFRPPALRPSLRKRLGWWDSPGLKPGFADSS